MTVTSPATAGSMTHISVHEVAVLLDQGAALIDVREHQETATGSAPGARFIPLQQFSLEELPADRALVLMCRSGARSGAAAQALAEMGFTTYNVVGGMAAWAAAGYPVMAEDGRPGRVL